MKTAVRICLFFTLICLSTEVARMKKDCSPPGQFANIRLQEKYRNTEKFSSGDRVYFDCEEGYRGEGGKRSVLCMDGKWSQPSLMCAKKSCVNAGYLPNGHFHYDGNSIGEKAHAVCNKGYTLKGQKFLTCESSGWTGDIPSCVEGEATCSAPLVINSVPMSQTVSDYKPGDELAFSCLGGFRLDGARLISCGSDGQWKPSPPQCLPLSHPTSSSPPPTQPRTQPDETPPHKDGGCDAPPPPSSASKVILGDKYAARSSFNSEEKVYYTCDVGYTPVAGSRSRHCHNGEWSPLKLKCERRLCGSAGEIPNGHFVYSGVRFGDTATGVCDEGYILVGRATRNCLSGGWDGRIPVCEVVSCEDPPEVKYAEMKGVETTYTYRSVVYYRCRAGTLVGPRELWCTKDGTWSSPPPQCKDVSCPAPNIPNGYWRGQRAKYQFRETISVVCNFGYKLVGPSSIICDKDGKWGSALPRCTRSKNSWNRRG